MKKRLTFLFAIVCFGWLSASSHGQVVFRDNEGANLYVQGTKGDDLILLWEKKGDILVYVNGKVTNVTKETGVSAKALNSVGINAFDGDDFISVESLPQLPKGTITNGGKGNDVVLKGTNTNKATGVERWKTEAAKVAALGKLKEVPSRSKSTE